ncbi:hypothetical protein HMPREF0322_01627 [Desulfitobacterium hafniense DP7]|uniref:Lipoprotein n=1 Tax=Desulfitobacterium hafniense DP7 TaxID=537010 RepID=G9XL16_DESHA|nr:hypothetical protein [Desulfitobacterium hafniense]EHL07733.1 hypothetical protein HMPREF0322_01627 [Desulfitobacterium hafniense DP7]
MMKKIVLIGAVFILICSMLSACGKVSNNKQNASDISSSQNSNIKANTDSSSLEQDDKTHHKAEGVEGKASIENISVKGGKIDFQIKNLTIDNRLRSAYLEYVPLKEGEEKEPYPLDCDKLNIPAHDISDVFSFNPQKPLGREGIIRIKKLVFENGKDNYSTE